MPSLENLVISAASSAGVVDIPESWYNLVRPGIIQYGPSPSNTMLNYLDLKHSHSLSTPSLKYIRYNADSIETDYSNQT